MSRADVEIKTKDGACRTAVFRPASGAGPWPAVIFYMDGVAIRPTLYDMCQRLADFGYLVLLPDMFYRVGTYEPFDGKTLFTDPVQRDKLMTMVRSATNKQLATEDTGSFLAYLDSLPDVKGKNVGATGYCMGGGFVLTVAAAYPDRFAAAASFHGGSLATDEPDSPHRVFDKIKARVLIIGLIRISTICQNKKRALRRRSMRRTSSIAPKSGPARCTVGRWRIYQFTSAKRPSGILMNCGNYSARF
jgi:carboxymethylenebutenolidase